MDSDKPTDPNGMAITQEDVLSYLVGAMQRIESQLASDEPPPWAKRLFGELAGRISVLEEEVQKIKVTCSAKHSNGSQLKLPLI
jgi:hypothetical protein